MAPPFVLLDLDGTLLDREPAIRRLLGRLAGRRPDADALVDALVAVDRDGKAARSLFLGQVLRRLSLPGGEDDLRQWFQLRMAEAYDPPAPATLEALDRLRAAGTRVAIVVNGDREAHEVVRGTGIGTHIDALVASDIDRVRKPDAGAFRLAATRTGASFSGDGWMIGDDPLVDIAGARAAGLRTAWIRRGRAWDAGIDAPDVVADDVASAIDAILAAG